MFFIQLENGEWWEYDLERSHLYNIRGGHTSADNIDLSKVIHLGSWHDLYLQTGFNPLKDNKMWHCGWIGPTGDFYPCEAHEVEAEYIYSLIYGGERGYYSDELVKLHWIKVTDSLMFDLYSQQGDYDSFYSREQEKRFDEWKKEFLF